jgi:hypothetical protein
MARSTTLDNISLSTKLEIIHSDCLEKTLMAASGVVRPIEAAAIQRELMDQYKGTLIALCRYGHGTTYDRICDNLSYKDPVAVIAVNTGAVIYHLIHGELSTTVMTRSVMSKDRIAETL